MLSAERNTIESLSTLGENRSRRGSAQSNPVLVLPFRFDPRESILNTTALSPPPVSGAPKPQPKNLHLRLRSDSGLSFHMNQSAFRQYTDYNPDGSTRSVAVSKRPLSFDEAGHADNISLGSGSTHFRDYSPRGRSIPNFFDRDVIKLAFCNPTTGQRLCRFAQSRHCAADVEFLLKVDEYTRALESMTNLIGHISTNFTGVAATSPLRLPADLLYQDAKTSVEERLAKSLYPDFIKYQLSQCMRSSLSVSRSLTGGFKSAYPGLGDAFCLTDPLEPDNPVVYASDGLLRMSGFSRHDVMNKNCRIMQGIYTDNDTTRRIREAVSLGQEAAELIVNHRKDGSPYWNLLFVCPLRENGSVRYYLGAQINVSESIGSDYKDILRILNFTLPGEDLSPQTIPTQERPVWKAPVEQNESRPPPRPTTSSTSTSASAAEDPPSAKRRAFTTRNCQLERETDEFSTPYSRFFVLRYAPVSPSQQHLSTDKRRNLPRLPVAFCSSFALELLGLKPTDADTIIGRDIFSVLADCINSPSVNRSLRANVTDKIAAGETISVDLMASADAPSKQQPPKHSRTGSAIRTGGPASLESETSRPRLSDTLDRGAEILSHVFFGSKMRKLSES
ncbi:hypothetical protein B0T26DRAFT_749456 [Lasiosphaeria miniovina]|uniref:PAS domain-containing protein n=1 Tax=Lasiosphaeria miniovina TaxID=1954250 RepID=A0AA40AU15_9PEZI|nr:uncharacterized protein B0T26DRAFT_749456 [Lasiosphaeria miniovina]KAK0721989.1 hypothetical protein B0T26DRAFT_749456 [Lasiosphaeria miniovina]